VNNTGTKKGSIM